MFYQELEEAHCKLVGKPFNRDFPTLGGSLGLYKEGGNSEEWPIDSRESATALIGHLEEDISMVAMPFWEALATRSKMLEAIEGGQKWAKRSDSWKYVHVILIYVERGIDNAMQFVAENPKKFREFSEETLKYKLLNLQAFKDKI
ncbi:hypothetical protein [Lignipirellula cremea]|uniref:hypothetical protein n=1 Tax=Lignipirellula cremea TaxID=2528010 RepID=UPI0011A0467E|nr:hypothetical protein [Lignipirellula cremea]